MCGRFPRKANLETILQAFPSFVADPGYIPYFRESEEVVPGTNILAFNNKYQAESIWWTIRDKDWQGKIQTPINAKAENLERAQMFRHAYITDRILIPATGIFEWQEQPDKTKKKFRIWFDEEIFMFAGIARDCEIKNEIKRSGVIITTTPNETFKWIHNTRQRQAVVIRKRDHEEWLDKRTRKERLRELMTPLPSEVTNYEEMVSIETK